MGPWGTPTLISSQADVFPLRAFLSNRLSDMSLCDNLKMKPVP